MNVEVMDVRILLMDIVRRFGNRFHSAEWLVENFFISPVELKGLS